MAKHSKAHAQSPDVVGDLRSYLRFIKSHGVTSVAAGDGAMAFLTGPAAPAGGGSQADAPAVEADYPPEFFETPWSPPDEPLTLPQLRSAVGDCRRCKLAPSRNELVFGVGSPNAELVFVGEAPGAEEDKRGEPFVGRAGQLLDKMIAAMGKSRKDIYICNVIKCRPPANRDPEADEVLACEPFLIKQIEAIAPKVICALGGHAAKTLLQSNLTIGKLRGRFHTYQDVKLLPTFHPAYLLRNGSQKRAAWEDLQMVMAELGWEAPK